MNAKDMKIIKQLSKHLSIAEDDLLALSQKGYEELSKDTFNARHTNCDITFSDIGLVASVIDLYLSDK